MNKTPESNTPSAPPGRRRSRRRASFLAAIAVLTSSRLVPGAESNDAIAPAKPGAGAAVADAGKPAGDRPLVIDGERFSPRTVRDTQQNGLAVYMFQAPEKWHDQNRVVWRYDYTSNPVAIWSAVENPDNEEAFYAYPAMIYFWLRPEGNYYRPGQNSGGLIFGRPMPPKQTLAAFVRQTRGNMSKLQLVGYKELPELPKILKTKPSPNQQGLGLKVTYELNGKPVEEEFYAVADSIELPYDGPQGRTWQINWGLTYLHSFRAPQGTLDRRRAVFAAMVKSVRINPAWEQRRAAVQAYLAEQFNRQLQAGYDSIAAAGRLSRQNSANNDAMIASIDHQLQSARNSNSSSDGNGAGGGTRSSTDNFDDYIRGVQTVDDPYWGTSQHSLNEQYHWTDGYGTYRNSNDASYNPNQHETGDWQLMQATQ